VVINRLMQYNKCCRRLILFLNLKNHSIMKGRVIDDYSTMKDDDLVSKGDLVYTCMKGNKHFKSPNPSMEKFNAGLAAYKNAVQANKTGGLVEKENRDAQRPLFLLLMKNLMTHVNYVADGDRITLGTTGYTLNAATRATGKKELGEIPLPVARPGKNSGEVMLQTEKTRNAKGLQWQITTTPVIQTSNWKPLSSKSRFTVKDLVRGTEYAARVCVETPDGQFVYSDPTIFIAI
jgi:hypothetical protein